jgi:O-6-methylguanine DNA methyltransferase
LGNVLDAVGLADRYIVRASSIGDVLVAYNQRGVSTVLPVAAHGGVAKIEAEFGARFGRPLHADPDPSSSFIRRVDRGLAGQRVKLEYDLRGVSEFGRAVLAKALEIPRGEVRPYGWIAAEIGRPNAVRAVGTALRRNPVPLLIPCHRVVRTDGRLGDYAFGSTAKVAALEAEGYLRAAASHEV